MDQLSPRTVVVTGPSTRMCIPLPVLSWNPPLMAFLPAGQTAFCVAAGVPLMGCGADVTSSYPLIPPAAPVAPVGPAGPAGPAGPGAPAGPVAPAGTVRPVAPGGPGGAGRT